MRQLETDRRLLRARIKNIRARLDKVACVNRGDEHARNEIPTVSLVGYTNAGNRPCLINNRPDVYGRPITYLTRHYVLDIGDVGPVILADTVGFIRHYHDLVAQSHIN